MKSKSSVFSQLLQNVSAALMIAAGASWLLLAVAIEHFDKDDTLEIECTVSAHSDSENTPSAKCVSIRSSKHNVLSSSRRSESMIQAPFVFHTFQNNFCDADICAKETPFLPFVADSANYVRAGPLEQYI